MTIGTLKSIQVPTKVVSSILVQDRARHNDPWSSFQSSFSREYATSGPTTKWKPGIEIINIALLPEKLLSALDDRDSSCFTGLLPQIRRAWLSSGNRLFIWNFQTGGDISCLDDFEQTILDVALIKPRSDVFVSTIEHLLAVVTSSMVYLFGVSFKGASLDDDIILHRTGLAFPSDDVRIVCLAGTSDGRILCGTNDGNILELVYQAEEGWLTRRCRTINRTGSWLKYLTPTFITFSKKPGVIALASDEQRGRLYALYDDNTLQVFSLGTFSSNFTCLASMTNTFSQAERLCPKGQLDRVHFKLFSISVTSPVESRAIEFLATSHCGARLFFSLSREGPWDIGPKASHKLNLIHVRLPAVAKSNRNFKDFSGFYQYTVKSVTISQGMSLLISDLDESTDSLDFYSLRPSLPIAGWENLQWHPSLEENHKLFVSGKVWDIQEVPSPLPDSYDTKNYSISFIDYISPIPRRSRRLLLLSNSGLAVIEYPNPFRSLRKQIIDGLTELELLEYCLEKFGRQQTVFVLCVLVVSETMHSGFPSAHHKVSAIVDGALHNLILQTLRSLDSRTTQEYYGQVDENAEGFLYSSPFSFLREGLCLFFARLVSSIWNESFQVLLFERMERLQEISLALYSFKDFIGSFIQIFTQVIDESGTMESQKKLGDSEKSLLHALSVLTKRSSELISIITIFRSYAVDIENLKESLKENPSIDFERLVSTEAGAEWVRQFCSNSIKAHLNGTISLGALPSALQQQCPQFFQSKDFDVLSGFEKVSKALNCSDLDERRSLLNQALRIFTSSSILSLAEIIQISSSFRKASFWTGAIDLCLFYSSIFDPENANLSNLRNPDAFLTVQQKESIAMKRALFAVVFEVIALALFNKSEGSSESALIYEGAVPSNEGMEAIRHALTLPDESFHITFYSWLIDNNMETVLLKLETSFLVSFLERSVKKGGQYLDLLWKYYASRNMHPKASRCLEGVASSTDLNLDLDKRIEYLSLASSFAKSGTLATGQNEMEYIRDVNERLEVAQLQREILDSTLELYGEVAEVADLRGSLFNITELFNRFTLPLNLSECSLYVLNSAAYRDPLLTHRLWRDIVQRSVGGGDKKDVDALSKKLASLVKRLYPSPYAFPLDFVMDIILRIVMLEKDPIEKAQRVLENSGIPRQDIVSQIENFFESPGFWNGDEAQKFLLGLKNTLNSTNRTVNFQK